MKKIAVILPCYNESNLIHKFNHKIVEHLEHLSYKFDLLYVNDGSIDDTVKYIKSITCKASNINIKLLDLTYNVGHQSAIYQGLLYSSNKPYDNVLIMDSDGEDDPNAISTILDHSDHDIVQVSRGKRSESLVFKLLYKIYKLIFYFLIGKKIDYGNFSLIKPRLVAAAVDNSFIHLGAFLDNQKGTKGKVKWNRSKRLDGQSKMSFTNLFYHGISSLTENAQSLLFFFIRLSILILIGIIVLSVTIIYKKYILNIAILGWSSTLLSNLLNSLLICIGFFVMGSLQLNLLSKQGKKRREKIFIPHTIVENWKDN
ncbi:glycosyltransferase [Nonlabens ponticola]|uniref:Glycosyltransferase n=1 Tax=Nonlabens ponticola TaxID=2496866 RepID=A0A3S9MZR1_9FLAO|nr:glycosyltransferase [Nonlabens ponticola]AZQ44572.1 glycosyltransferase [Nonlabens ponticola]